MVKIIQKNGKEFFQCKECDFYYDSNFWADKCEAFCKKNKSCSIEITKHSVKI